MRYSVIILGFTVLVTLTGCDQSLRSWLKSFDRRPPHIVVLREAQGAERVEYWIGIREISHIDSVAMHLQPLCSAADHEIKMSARGPAKLPERIYYVYVSPEPWKQHEWNVATDEPNYIYRCLDGEMSVLSKREGFYRDENNTLMPSGWRPPPRERETKPWYIGVVKVGLGVLALFIFMSAIALFGRRPKDGPRSNHDEAAKS